MKTNILCAAVTVVCLTLAGAVGVGSYLAGYQEGTRTARSFLRGYTILTPEILENRPPDADQSDLGFDDFETILDVAYGTDSLYKGAIKPGVPRKLQYTPFLIVQGFDDPSVPPHQADRLFVRLRNANVDADCLLIPGASHGGPPLETLSSRKFVADFFRKHLLDN